MTAPTGNRAPSGNFTSGLLKIVSVAASLFVSIQILAHFCESDKLLDSEEKRDSYRKGSKNVKKLKLPRGTLSSRQITLSADISYPDELTVSFDDIGGLMEVKEQLKSNILLPMQFNSQLETQENFLIRPPSGIIFHGPPGCGKTMLAMALAKAADCKILCLKSSSIFDKYNGETEKNIRALFDLAVQLKPFIIFIDELDCIFKQRGEFGSDSKVFFSEFLIFLDKIGSKDKAFDNCLFIGATNRLSDIDDAILRRFPLKIEITKPNEFSRLSILMKILKNSNIDPKDVEQIAYISEGKTGSDLFEICRNATLYCLSESLKEGTSSKRLDLNLSHFKNVLPKLDHSNDEDSLYTFV